LITDLIYGKDKYHELFASVINLLKDSSLTPTSQLREAIDILELARSKANSAIIRAIRESNMDASKKDKLEQIHKEDHENARH